MPINVRVNHVLRRSGVAFQGLRKFFPVTGAVLGVKAITRIDFRIERSPTQRIAPAVFVQNDWAMARDCYIKCYGVCRGIGKAFAYPDLFVTDLGILPARRRLVAPWIIRIKFLEVEILDVRTNVRKAQAM